MSTQSQVPQGVQVIGPDGKKYVFPKGTTKDKAIAYFNTKGIGAKPKQDAPPEGFFQKIARQSGEESQQYMNRAFGPEAQGRGVLARSGSAAMGLERGANQVASEIIGGFADPKNLGALASGFLHPAIPSLYFGSQGVKGAKDNWEDIQKNGMTPDNVRGYLESLSMVAGSAAGVKGESPALKAIDKARPMAHEFLRQHAAELNTKALKLADSNKADYKTSSALKMAQEGIWGRIRTLPDAIEKARMAKHQEVIGRAAALDQQGVSVNVENEIRPVVNAVLGDLAAKGRIGPEAVSATRKFVNFRVLNELDPRTGQWMPRDLTKLPVSKALKLTEGLGDTSGFEKADITTVERLSRGIRQVLNDKIGQSDPRIQQLRADESKLIDDRTAARDLKEQVLNDKMYAVKSVYRSSNVGPIAFFVALRGLGVPWVTALGSVLTLKALAESTPSRTLRAALYAKGADMLDSHTKAVTGATGGAGASGGGTGMVGPFGPQPTEPKGFTGQSAGLPRPTADAQVVYTNPPSGPTRGTQLPEKASRAKAGSGDYVKGTEAKPESVAAPPRQSVAQSNTKSAAPNEPKAAHDYKSLLSDALARRGSTKSGWETQSLEKQIAELSRAASGKATKEELKTINQHITARQRVTAQRAASASQATPTAVGTGGSGAASGSLEGVASGAMSPEMRALLLEQGYAKLATFENGPNYVKALKEQARIMERGGMPHDEVTALTDAINALVELEGKK